MSLHEIGHSREPHSYIHLPHCGKNVAWRIRRFGRQIWQELKLLLRSSQCICQAPMVKSKVPDPKPRIEDYLNEHNFPKDEYWDVLYDWQMRQEKEE